MIPNRTLVLFLIILYIQFQGLEGRGELTIRLVSFDNDYGLTYDGGCCDNWQARGWGCMQKCDYVMRVVISGLSRANDHVFLFHRPLMYNQNNIIFDDCPWATELSIPFDTWPGQVELSAYFYDYDDNDDTTLLVDWFDTRLRREAISTSFQHMAVIGSRRHYKTRLTFDWAINCAELSNCVRSDVKQFLHRLDYQDLKPDAPLSSAAASAEEPPKSMSTQHKESTTTTEHLKPVGNQSTTIPIPDNGVRSRKKAFPEATAGPPANTDSINPWITQSPLYSDTSWERPPATAGTPRQKSTTERLITTGTSNRNATMPVSVTLKVETSSHQLLPNENEVHTSQWAKRVTETTPEASTASDFPPPITSLHTFHPGADTNISTVSPKEGKTTKKLYRGRKNKNPYYGHETIPRFVSRPQDVLSKVSARHKVRPALSNKSPNHRAPELPTIIKKTLGNNKNWRPWKKHDQQWSITNGASKEAPAGLEKVVPRNNQQKSSAELSKWKGYHKIPGTLAVNRNTVKPDPSVKSSRTITTAGEKLKIASHSYYDQWFTGFQPASTMSRIPATWSEQPDEPLPVFGSAGQKSAPKSMGPAETVSSSPIITTRVRPENTQVREATPTKDDSVSKKITKSYGKSRALHPAPVGNFEKSRQSTSHFKSADNNPIDATTTANLLTKAHLTTDSRDSMEGKPSNRDKVMETTHHGVTKKNTQIDIEPKDTITLPTKPKSTRNHPVISNTQPKFAVSQTYEERKDFTDSFNTFNYVSEESEEGIYFTEQDISKKGVFSTNVWKDHSGDAYLTNRYSTVSPGESLGSAKKKSKGWFRKATSHQYPYRDIVRGIFSSNATQVWHRTKTYQPGSTLSPIATSSPSEEEKLKPWYRAKNKGDLYEIVKRIHTAQTQKNTQQTTPKQDNSWIKSVTSIPTWAKDILTRKASRKTVNVPSIITENIPLTTTIKTAANSKGASQAIANRNPFTKPTAESTAEIKGRILPTRKPEVSQTEVNPSPRSLITTEQDRDNAGQSVTTVSPSRRPTQPRTLPVDVSADSKSQFPSKINAPYYSKGTVRFFPKPTSKNENNSTSTPTTPIISEESHIDRRNISEQQREKTTAKSTIIVDTLSTKDKNRYPHRHLPKKNILVTSKISDPASSSILLGNTVTTQKHQSTPSLRRNPFLTDGPVSTITKTKIWLPLPLDLDRIPSNTHEIITQDGKGEWDEKTPTTKRGYKWPVKSPYATDNAREKNNEWENYVTTESNWIDSSSDTRGLLSSVHPRGRAKTTRAQVSTRRQKNSSSSWWITPLLTKDTNKVSVTNMLGASKSPTSKIPKWIDNLTELKKTKVKNALNNENSYFSKTTESGWKVNSEEEIITATTTKYTSLNLPDDSAIDTIENWWKQFAPKTASNNDIIKTTVQSWTRNTWQRFNEKNIDTSSTTIQPQQTIHRLHTTTTNTDLSDLEDSTRDSRLEVDNITTFPPRQTNTEINTHQSHKGIRERTLNSTSLSTSSRTPTLFPWNNWRTKSTKSPETRKSTVKSTTNELISSPKPSASRNYWTNRSTQIPTALITTTTTSRPAVSRKSPPTRHIWEVSSTKVHRKPITMKTKSDGSPVDSSTNAPVESSTRSSKKVFVPQDSSINNGDNLINDVQTTGKILIPSTTSGPSLESEAAAETTQPPWTRNTWRRFKPISSASLTEASTVTSGKPSSVPSTKQTPRQNTKYPETIETEPSKSTVPSTKSSTRNNRIPSSTMKSRTPSTTRNSRMSSTTSSSRMSSTTSNSRMSSTTSNSKVASTAENRDDLKSFLSDEDFDLKPTPEPSDLYDYFETSLFPTSKTTYRDDTDDEESSETVFEIFPVAASNENPTDGNFATVKPRLPEPEDTTSTLSDVIRRTKTNDRISVAWRKEVIDLLDKADVPGSTEGQSSEIPLSTVAIDRSDIKWDNQPLDLINPLPKPNGTHVTQTQPSTTPLTTAYPINETQKSSVNTTTNVISTHHHENVTMVTANDFLPTEIPNSTELLTGSQSSTGESTTSSVLLTTLIMSSLSTVSPDSLPTTILALITSAAPPTSTQHSTTRRPTSQLSTQKIPSTRLPSTARIGPLSTDRRENITTTPPIASSAQPRKYSTRDPGSIKVTLPDLIHLHNGTEKSVNGGGKPDFILNANPVKKKRPPVIINAVAAGGKPTTTAQPTDPPTPPPTPKWREILPDLITLISVKIPVRTTPRAVGRKTISSSKPVSPASPVYQNADHNKRTKPLDFKTVVEKYWPAILGSFIGAVFLTAAILTSVLCKQQRIFLRRSRSRPQLRRSPASEQASSEQPEITSSSSASLCGDL